MSDKVSVTLAGPAKVDGRWKKAGDTVTVDPDLVAQLPVEGGVLDLDPSAADKERTLVETLTDALEAERARADIAEATAADLGQQLTAALADVASLRGEIDALKDAVPPATEDRPPVERDTEAAKTASKKTGSSTKG